MRGGEAAACPCRTRCAYLQSGSIFAEIVFAGNLNGMSPTTTLFLRIFLPEGLPLKGRRSYPARANEVHDIPFIDLFYPFATASFGKDADFTASSTQYRLYFHR